MIVRITASIMVATGLFQLLRHGLRSYWHFFTHFGECTDVVGPLIAALVLVLMLIPILKLPATIGLFTSKRWGWILAIALLSLDFVFGLHGAIRMCGFSFAPPPSPPPLVGPHTVVKVSMWPTYIIAIIGIASILVLIQKPIMKQFNPKEEIA